MYVNHSALLADQQGLEGTSVGGLFYESFGANAGDYLWTSNLTSQDFETFLVYKNRTGNGRFFMQDFLTMLGDARRKPGFGPTYSWAEQPVEDYGVVVDTIITALPAVAVTIDTTSTVVLRQQYDRLNSSSGFQWEVTSAVLSGGKERLVIQRVDGANTTAAQLVTGQILGDGGNAWPEGSVQPTGRTTFPVYNSNFYSITKESYDYTGSALANRSMVQVKIGESATTVITAAEREAIDRFQKKREDALMWHEQTAQGSAVHSTRGIVRDVEANAGAFTLYGAALLEADLQSQMVSFDALNDNDTFVGLSGGSAYREFHAALANYTDSGAVDYGTFNQDSFNAVGLKLKSYSYADKTIIMKRYRGFDDTNTTGGTTVANTPSATETNYKQFILFLNMGESAGTDQEGARSPLPYLCYKYKALDGVVDRSIVVGWEKGMTGRTNNVMDQMINGGSDANGLIAAARSNLVAGPTDADHMYLLSEIGPMLLCVDTAHGYMRADA